MLAALVCSSTSFVVTPALMTPRLPAVAVSMQVSDDSRLCLREKIEKQLQLPGGAFSAYAMFRDDCKDAFSAVAVDGKVSVSQMQTLMGNAYGKETTEEDAAAMMERAGSSADGVIGYEAWIKPFLEDCEPPASKEKKGGFFGMFG